MTKLASSPDRHTFGKTSFINRTIHSGGDIESDEVKEILAVFDLEKELVSTREKDPKWTVNNLEYDLRSTEWVIEKARSNVDYAQNLYAALCNNDFLKLDVVPILTNSLWSCSWRYAGGIVADIRGEGDYINWYCSGIADGSGHTTGYVPEGVVTSEVKQDLRRLGWVVKDD
jgi:hypothetical protein